MPEIQREYSQERPTALNANPEMNTAPVPTYDSERQTHQAYQILHLAFSVAPIVAGLDKFTDYLVNWDNYLAPVVSRVSGIAPHNFMMGVGVIEVIAGIGVILKPKIFAYVVSAWIAGIIVNLLLTKNYYDIALRDLGLCLGALALGRLANHFDPPKSKPILH